MVLQFCWNATCHHDLLVWLPIRSFKYQNENEMFGLTFRMIEAMLGHCSIMFPRQGMSPFPWSLPFAAPYVSGMSNPAGSVAWSLEAGAALAGAQTNLNYIYRNRYSIIIIHTHIIYIYMYRCIISWPFMASRFYELVRSCRLCYKTLKHLLNAAFLDHTGAWSKRLERVERHFEL